MAGGRDVEGILIAEAETSLTWRDGLSDLTVRVHVHKSFTWRIRFGVFILRLGIRVLGGVGWVETRGDV